MLGQTTPSYSLGFKKLAFSNLTPQNYYCFFVCCTKFCYISHDLSVFVVVVLIRPTNFTNKLLIIRSYIYRGLTHIPPLQYVMKSSQWFKQQQQQQQNRWKKLSQSTCISSMTCTQRWAVLRNVLSDPWHQIHFSDVKMKGEKRGRNAVWAHKTSVSHGVWKDRLIKSI